MPAHAEDFITTHAGDLGSARYGGVQRVAGARRQRDEPDLAGAFHGARARATGDAITATTGYLFAASRAAASAALKVLLGRITAFTFSLSAMK